MIKNRCIAAKRLETDQPEGNSVGIKGGARWNKGLKRRKEERSPKHIFPMPSCCRCAKEPMAPQRRTGRFPALLTDPADHFCGTATRGRRAGWPGGTGVPFPGCTLQGLGRMVPDFRGPIKAKNLSRIISFLELGRAPTEHAPQPSTLP